MSSSGAWHPTEEVIPACETIIKQIKLYRWRKYRRMLEARLASKPPWWRRKRPYTVAEVIEWANSTTGHSPPRRIHRLHYYDQFKAVRRLLRQARKTDLIYISSGDFYWISDFYE